MEEILATCAAIALGVGLIDLGEYFWQCLRYHKLAPENSPKPKEACVVYGVRYTLDTQ